MFWKSLLKKNNNWSEILDKFLAEYLKRSLQEVSEVLLREGLRKSLSNIWKSSWGKMTQILGKNTEDFLIWNLGSKNIRKNLCNILCRNSKNNSFQVFFIN